MLWLSACHEISVAFAGRPILAGIPSWGGLSSRLDARENASARARLPPHVWNAYFGSFEESVGDCKPELLLNSAFE
jgi:hypothetical protein